MSPLAQLRACSAVVGCNGAASSAIVYPWCAPGSDQRGTVRQAAGFRRMLNASHRLAAAVESARKIRSTPDQRQSGSRHAGRRGNSVRDASGQAGIILPQRSEQFQTTGRAIDAQDILSTIAAAIFALFGAVCSHREAERSRDHLSVVCALWRWPIRRRRPELRIPHLGTVHGHRQRHAGLLRRESVVGRPGSASGKSAAGQAASRITPGVDLFAPNDQIVAVNDFAASAESEN